jgi:hypothetical protein
MKKNLLNCFFWNILYFKYVLNFQMSLFFKKFNNNNINIIIKGIIPEIDKKLPWNQKQN